jgi:acetolactate synthase-1/2/3 large subunit
VTDVGERLVERLMAYGVVRVFGVPGGQTAPFYHGLALHQGKIDHVLMRDERSAVFAADAYARVSGRVGVSDATVGPGATNLVSGLVEAYSSSIPVLAVIADIPRSWAHRRHLGSASQGFEQRDFLEPCVKWYGRVETPEQLDDVLDNCIRVATSNRPGPVVIEIPDDVFSASASEEPHPDNLDARFPRLRFAPDPAAVEIAADAVRAAERPLILAGGGVHISGACEEVAALANGFDLPVATTISGKSAIAETDPLALGLAGAFGSPVVNEVLGEADCVIAVGCKLGQAATSGWEVPGPAAKIVHIDVDAEEIGRNFPRTLALQSDARLGLRGLREALEASAPTTAWDLDELAARVDDVWADDTYKAPLAGDRIKPQQVMRELAARLGDDDMIVTDASLSSGWAASRWRTGTTGRHVVAPRGVAGLGWGLPAAIGAAFARRDRGDSGRVVCLAGDGGWGYSFGELETIARFEIALPSVLLNNSTLAWNKHVALNRYPDALISQGFTEVDWATTSVGLGAWAERVEEAEGIGAALDRALAVEGRPAVVELLSSEHETPVLKSMSGASRADAPKAAY